MKLRAVGRSHTRCTFLWGLLLLLAASWDKSGVWADEIVFSLPDPSHSIQVSADSIVHWPVGQYDVLHLSGSVRLRQGIGQPGSLAANSGEAILWIERQNGANQQPNKVIVYLEDQVLIERYRGGDSSKGGLNQNQAMPPLFQPAGELETDRVDRNTGWSPAPKIDLPTLELASPTGPTITPAASTNSTSLDRMVDEVWLGRLYTRGTVDLARPLEPLADRPVPEIFRRAQAALENGLTTSVGQTAFAAPIAQQSVVNPRTGAVNQIVDPNQPPAFGSSVPGSSQAVEINRPGQVISESQSSSRSPFGVQITGRDGGSLPSFKYFTNPQNPNEQIGIGVGGFRVLVESPSLNQMDAFRGDEQSPVVLLADSLVQWQTTNPDGSQSQQFYLEGNIVFAKDRRVIYAEKMFYDVQQQRGTLLDADVLTPVPSYNGLVRLKADIVQQVDENNMQAYGTALTSSRLGVPRYWLQSGTISLNRQLPDPTAATGFFPPLNAQGMPITDRGPGNGFGGPDGFGTAAGGVSGMSGPAVAEEEHFLESTRNRVYVAGVPVFAWPRFRTSLNDPDLYLKRFSINNDGIFGTQIRTGWNIYQILGWEQPAGSEWIGVVDYLSRRGLGYGSERRYQQDSFLGIPGEVAGEFNSWFLRDQGNDFLGRGRFGLEPETRNRGRILARHRHRFDSGWLLRGEIGYVSDRNFLEQFYERDWDRDKDATTGIWLQQNIGSQSYNLVADYQINEFFTQTSWLPRFDQFTLGQSLLGDQAVWHGHTHAGYGRLRVASTPLAAAEQAVFDPLAWEADVQGVRVGTRQQLDFPVQLGPTKVVPYVLGDLSYWQQDLQGNDALRAVGQVGLRASLPFWKVNPMIQSELLNVNGLAHKISFDVEALYADASQDIRRLPLYDQLDDDSQEHFRRRFAFETFGVVPGDDIPLEFDERYFALRSGMQRYVTAPSMEIADDLALVRLGVRQRWQTKRGMPGSERIIDWITLDAQATLFPDAERDNFGSDLGMFDYNFNWYVGDRFALVSDGYLDFFSQGLRTVSLGGRYGRPDVGTLNLKYRMIEGPISSNIISAFANYRLSDKWGASLGGQLDLGSTGQIGQFLDLVYIGESFLWQVGGNYDFGRDNFSIRFGFEPRFAPQPRIFRPGGSAIPPASSRFLE